MKESILLSQELREQGRGSLDGMAGQPRSNSVRPIGVRRRPDRDNGDLDIWRAILSPFVPQTVSLDDGSFSYEGDEFLPGDDGRDDIRLFSQRPEVLVAN